MDDPFLTESVFPTEVDRLRFLGETAIGLARDMGETLDSVAFEGASVESVRELLAGSTPIAIKSAGVIARQLYRRDDEECRRLATELMDAATAGARRWLRLRERASLWLWQQEFHLP